MPRRHWLLKCEPELYTIADLERDRTTPWEGVRNYQARNLLRDDLRVGDGVLFYASNADPAGVTGLAEIVRAGFPDPTAWKPGHEGFDPKSTRAAPVWFAVEIRFVERFPAIVPLATLKATAGLEKMVVTQRGSRLSVQPVTGTEYNLVVRLGRRQRTRRSG